MVRPLNPNKGDSFKNDLHTLVAGSKAPIDGLVDGNVYFVHNPTSTGFQLSSTIGGGAINLDLSRDGLYSNHSGNVYTNVNVNSGGHTFAFEGLNLTSSPAGEHWLVHDISGFNDTDGGQFSGVGGASSLAGAESGDFETTSGTSSKSGGGVSVGSITSDADAIVTTNLTIFGGATLVSDGTIEVLTLSRADVNANSEGLNIGLVSVGGSNAYADITNTTLLTVHDNATLTARANLSVRATSKSDATASASSDGGGLFGSADTKSHAFITHQTEALVAGDLTAGGTLLVEGFTDANAENDAISFAAGVVGSVNANDNNTQGARVGEGTSYTKATITGTANLVGSSVIVRSDTAARADSYGRSKSAALGADSDAGAYARVDGTTQTTLQTMAMITAQVNTTIEASLSKLVVYAKSDAKCSCAGGSTDSNATDISNAKAKVIGEQDAFIWTSNLYVNVLGNDPSITRTRNRSGAWLDGGGKGGSETKNVRRHIDWESTTIILGEPNPSIHIDPNGIHRRTRQHHRHRR